MSIFNRPLGLTKPGQASRGDDFLRDMRQMMEKVWGNGWDVATPALSEKLPSGVSFAPRFEVHETDTAVELSAELPGLEEKDVEVHVTREAVTIQGEKKIETRKEEKGALYTERSYGKFYRTLPLKWDVDRERVEATFKNGVLNVHLPKTTAAKNDVRKVSIRAN